MCLQHKNCPILQNYLHIPYKTSTNEPYFGTYCIGDLKLKEENMMQVLGPPMGCFSDSSRAVLLLWIFF